MNVRRQPVCPGCSAQTRLYVSIGATAVVARFCADLTQQQQIFALQTAECGHRLLGISDAAETEPGGRQGSAVRIPLSLRQVGGLHSKQHIERLLVRAVEYEHPRRKYAQFRRFSSTRPLGLSQQRVRIRSGQIRPRGRDNLRALAR